MEQIRNHPERLVPDEKLKSIVFPLGFHCGI
jgi:hypothetical protein